MIPKVDVHSQGRCARYLVAGCTNSGGLSCDLLVHLVSALLPHKAPTLAIPRLHSVSRSFHCCLAPFDNHVHQVNAPVNDTAPADRTGRSTRDDGTIAGEDAEANRGHAVAASSSAVQSAHADLTSGRAPTHRAPAQRYLQRIVRRVQRLLVHARGGHCTSAA